MDALFKLAAAGVRSAPYNASDGVLLMELITDADSNVRSPISTTWP